jgi:membrane-associated phospholipid phosphatase
VTRRRGLTYLLIAVGLVAYGRLHRFGTEHLALVVVAGLLGALSERTRDLLVSVIPMILFGFVYSFMEVFQSRSFDIVSVEPIYRLEETLFGWLPPDGSPLGPLDFFRDHHHPLLDAAGGLLYASHMPVVIGFGLLLWWQRRRTPTSEASFRLHNFMWGFLAMSLVGLAIQALYPVAPPWYVDKFGFSPPGEPIQGDPAALSRVDAMLGFAYFEGVYAQATYVFGALPSLHVATPAWVALHTRHRLARLVAWGYTAAMSFAAVYLIHHYIVDVLAGLLLAVGVYLLFQRTSLGGYPPRLYETAFDLLFGEPREAPATRSERSTGSD